MKMTNLNCLLASLIVFAPLLAAEAAPTQAKNSTKKLIRQAPSTDAAAGQAYSARLWNRILSQWNYPDGSNHVTLSAVVVADGTVESLQVTSSPKSVEAEASAQAAFDKAKPLEALPTGMPKATVVITFNSKSDPHGDSSSGGSVRLDPVNSK
jgi:TonB family protein